MALAQCARGRRDRERPCSRGTTLVDEISPPKDVAIRGGQNEIKSLGSYLLHGAKHLIASPLWEAPVIVVLLDSSDRKRCVDAAAATEEFCSGQNTLATVEAGLWRRDEVPVRLARMVQGPSTPCKLSTMHLISSGTHAPTMCTLSTSVLSAPASSNSILRLGSSDRRAETAEPLVPPL